MYYSELEGVVAALLPGKLVEYVHHILLLAQHQFRFPSAHVANLEGLSSSWPAYSCAAMQGLRTDVSSCCS